MKDKLKTSTGLLARAGGRLIPALARVAAVVVLARLNLVGLAVIASVVLDLWTSYREGGDLNRLIQTSPRMLVGISLTGLIGLSAQSFSTWIAAASYVLWLTWFNESRAITTDLRSNLVVAGISQLVSLEAIFIGASVWHWPTIVIVALVWGSSFLVADRLLQRYSGRRVVATAWALVASEISWIFSVWVVSYVINVLPRGGLTLIVPQATVVLTALGYCFGGIYLAHTAGRLNRARLLEYLMIGLVLLVMVIAGTKWNGVI